MGMIHMGLNSITDEKVKEFVETVEREGVAEASWSCTGRTLHHILACQLADRLKDKGYEWEIGYNYLCRARKQ